MCPINPAQQWRKLVRQSTLAGIGILTLVLNFGCTSHSRSKNPEQQNCIPVCSENQPKPERNGVYDPFEPINREIFRFNTGFDAVIVNPTLQLYRSVTVPPVRAGVSNFLRNLVELPNALNIFLQNNPRGALQSVERFIINSTLGVFGLFDIAGYMGAKRQNETFAQTLAVWGMKPGPYLVVPILGPSRIRDLAGLGVSFEVTPRIAPYHLTGQSSVNIGLARAGAVRERFLDISQEVYATQVDPYSAVRDFYVRTTEANVIDRGIPDDPVNDVGNYEEDVYDGLTDFEDF